MTADMDADTTFSVTYSELATKLGITVPSAKTLVRRHRWEKRQGNDGLMRVLVPIDYLKNERGESRHDGSHDSSHDGPHDSRHESPAGDRQIAPGTVEAIAALERHVGRLEADMAATTTALMSARNEIEGMRATALAEAVTSAAMKATLEAVTAERDRLLTREHLRDQRRWWWRLAG
jgi:hypothetical protein